ncbi:tetratricopeptide repeat protein [Candidatus Saccharibacteria bacterium]|nr:tetratricopeptide repeat protein [Candidatus Saccharibacteria bacterium]
MMLQRAWNREPKAATNNVASGLTARLDKLWEVAQESIQERKYLRAERALLTILKVDERSATAYNRLGILYAKQKEYSDAIECFEIAQSLEPSASSLHNVGLIYYETENYPKAAIAFEQALAMEDNHASRYIAYGKVQEKLGNYKKMIDAYEQAVTLEPSPQMLRFVADAYARTNQPELAERANAELAQINSGASVSHTKAKPAARRVVM